MRSTSALQPSFGGTGAVRRAERDQPGREPDGSGDPAECSDGRGSKCRNIACGGRSGSAQRADRPFQAAGNRTVSAAARRLTRVKGITAGWRSAKLLDAERFRPALRVDFCAREKRFPAIGFRLCRKHLAPLPEGRMRNLLQPVRFAGQGRCDRLEMHDGGGHLRWRREGLRRNVEGHMGPGCASRRARRDAHSDCRPRAPRSAALLPSGT